MVNLKTGTENDHGNKALVSSEEKQAVASRWQHCVRFTSKRAALPGAKCRSSGEPLATLSTIYFKKSCVAGRNNTEMGPTNGLVERENERIDFASQRDKRLLLLFA